MKINWNKIQKINFGLTNNNYHYQNFIIRESIDICEVFLDHNNEKKILKYVQDLNVPIEKIFIKQKRHYYITKYIDHSYTLDKDNITNEQIMLISNIIKKLHLIKINDKNIKKWDWFQQWQLFKSLVKKPNFILEEEEKLVAGFFNKYIPERQVLSHNDLVPGNFLFAKNKLYLIDYEYCMINDYLFDISSFINESLTKKDDIKLWLKQFNLSKNKKIIIFWWWQYQNIIWFYWANYLYEKTNKIIYLQILNEKYQKLQNKKEYYDLFLL